MPSGLSVENHNTIKASLALILRGWCIFLWWIRVLWFKLANKSLGICNL